MTERITPTKSKQTPGNIFLVVLLCVSGGLFPLILFVVKWLSTDLDTALETFCAFVDTCFND